MTYLLSYYYDFRPVNIRWSLTAISNVYHFSIDVVQSKKWPERPLKRVPLEGIVFWTAFFQPCFKRGKDQQCLAWINSLFSLASFFSVSRLFQSDVLIPWWHFIWFFDFDTLLQRGVRVGTQLLTDWVPSNVYLLSAHLPAKRSI